MNNRLKPAKEMNVLIVDDEKIVRDFLSRVLLREGHRPEVAGSGTQGYKMLLHKDYDMIICDVHMPNMSGIEFFKKINTQWPQYAQKIVFTTGDIQNSDIAYKMTGRPHIGKPIRLYQFKRLLSEFSPG